MPRRTRRQLVGPHEDYARFLREREYAALLLVLRREWRTQLAQQRSRDVA